LPPPQRDNRIKGIWHSRARGREHGGTGELGAVFELVIPIGAGNYQEKVLVSFNGTDGNQPVGTLALDSSGNLYGTTSSGGPNPAGIVFEVTP
jgi:uncharacterized repeat protein (TIGR03803 family)